MLPMMLLDTGLVIALLSDGGRHVAAASASNELLRAAATDRRPQWTRGGCRLSAVQRA